MNGLVVHDHLFESIVLFQLLPYPNRAAATERSKPWKNPHPACRTPTLKLEQRETPIWYPSLLHLSTSTWFFVDAILVASLCFLSSPALGLLLVVGETTRTVVALSARSTRPTVWVNGSRHSKLQGIGAADTAATSSSSLYTAECLKTIRNIERPSIPPLYHLAATTEPD